MDWIETGRMDELGRVSTPVHHLDARAKLVVTMAFVGTVMSYGPYEVSALTPFLAYPLFLLARGRIPLRFVARKVLIAAPFALVVGMFNPLLDRQPVTPLGPWMVTGGWLSFASILLRFILCVGAALALVACTGIHRLTAGLTQLGVPRVFVNQLLFLYRYLFVITDQGSRMMRSVDLRLATPHSLRLTVYGSLIGHLLLRALDRAERIHQAMVARGFDGHIRVAVPPALQVQDWAFATSWLVFFAFARMHNLANVLGQAFTGGEP
jgi:cobalt/nickel transport system permease protein